MSKIPSAAVSVAEYNINKHRPVQSFVSGLFSHCMSVGNASNEQVKNASLSEALTLACHTMGGLTGVCYDDLSCTGFYPHSHTTIKNRQ